MSVPALAAFMRQEASWGTDGLGELSQLLGKKAGVNASTDAAFVRQEASWGQSVAGGVMGAESTSTAAYFFIRFIVR